ncbi:type IV pilus secretin PilQ [Moraxella nasovis]|uniref:type IV pilus secretin PilQ n=1 Tax=Moraxella nasovis TaxID=2904121 RepID=UPI001F62097D|nr:type IV pilus secretin PilQ [Moraxella nasovis]UNU72860.1 type IV pilus secretin PilQ [Moraxella nasovis]
MTKLINAMPTWQKIKHKLGVFMLVLPLSALAAETNHDTQYHGDRISVDFYDMPVQAVINALATVGKTNIIVSDKVAGNITLKLNHVPWDQALSIVLDSKNLIKTTNNGVLAVMTADELADINAQKSKSQSAYEETLPLQTEYIRLHYADIKDVQKIILGESSQKAGTQAQAGLLSARGTLGVDTRTNTLIIKDTADNLADIHDVLAYIDVPVDQVMIEARIVSASDKFSRELGVNFGILSNQSNLQVGGSQTTLWDMRTTDYMRRGVHRPDNLSVNLGAINPAGRIAFGILNMSDVVLDLELSAMQADNRGEVISTPKVLTADKQTARISSGMQIAYQEETSSGATNSVFKEAALVLEATPSITPDGKINLKLLIKNGTPVTNLGSIAIQEDSIETRVQVEDGQTVVLGGVYRHMQGKGVKKVPFLGDLPLVGGLFRNESRMDDKEELMIFITPKLVK